MRNLLKYELKQGFLPYLAMGVVFLAGVLGLAVMIKFGNGKYIFTSSSESAVLALVATLSVFLLVISVVGFGVVQILNVVNAFGKNLFGVYGYLLFCLPLGVDRILLAKVLGCFILIGASLVFCCVVGFSAVVYISDFRVFGIFGEFIERLSRVDIGISLAFIATNLSYYLCNTLEFLLQILLTLAVLNYLRVTSFSFALGIVIFICISMITSTAGAVCKGILDFIGMLPTMPNDFFHSWGIMRFQRDDLFVDFMRESLRISFVVYKIFSYILTSLVFYLCARFLIIRKLELE